MEYTLRLVRVLQTYGPISGRGCLLDEPASQWEACIYMRTFATHLPISMCPVCWPSHRGTTRNELLNAEKIQPRWKERKVSTNMFLWQQWQANQNRSWLVTRLLAREQIVRDVMFSIPLRDSTLLGPGRALTVSRLMKVCCLISQIDCSGAHH